MEKYTMILINNYPHITIMKDRLSTSEETGRANDKCYSPCL